MNEIFEAYYRQFGVWMSIPFGLTGSNFYLYMYGIHKAMETGVPYDPEPLLDYLRSFDPPGVVVH